MADDTFRRDIALLLPRLRRFARVLAGQPADADDLVQQTVERALRAREQWKEGTRLDSWMFRIMKNSWIDETRARGVRTRVFAAEEAGAAVGDNAREAMDLRLEALEAARAIARLPEDQRLVVALVLVDGLSYREAAEILDIPMGTLTSRLARGRAAIEAAVLEQAP